MKVKCLRHMQFVNQYMRQRRLYNLCESTNTLRPSHANCVAIPDLRLEIQSHQLLFQSVQQISMFDYPNCLPSLHDCQHLPGATNHACRRAIPGAAARPNQAQFVHDRRSTRHWVCPPSACKCVADTMTPVCLGLYSQKKTPAQQML